MALLKIPLHEAIAGPVGSIACMHLLCDQDCHTHGAGGACYKQGSVPVILCLCCFVTLTKSLSSFDGKHLRECHAAAHLEPCGGKLIETGSK